MVMLKCIRDPYQPAGPVLIHTLPWSGPGGPLCGSKGDWRTPAGSSKLSSEAEEEVVQFLISSKTPAPAGCMCTRPLNGMTRSLVLFVASL
ncbi:unnamed protein product [Lota lota]